MRCARTLGEIHGQFVSGSGDGNVAMQPLQGDTPRYPPGAAGLGIITAAFGDGRIHLLRRLALSTVCRTVHVSNYQRVDNSTPALPPEMNRAVPQMRSSPFRYPALNPG